MYMTIGRHVRTADLFGLVTASLTVVDSVTEHGLVHALSTAIAARVAAGTFPLA